MNCFSKSILITTAILSVSACSNAQSKSEPMKTAAKPSVKMSHTGYSKPSAAVQFRHDFSGRSSLGVTESIKVQVTDRYEDAKVELKVYPSDGIQMFSRSELQKVNSPEIGITENEMNLQFQPRSEGVHNISVVAIVTLKNGQVITQSQTIPVYVGDQFKPTKRTPQEKALTNPGKPSGGMVIMDAEETIVVSD